MDFINNFFLNRISVLRNAIFCLKFEEIHPYPIIARKDKTFSIIYIFSTYVYALYLSIVLTFIHENSYHYVEN